MRERTGIPRQVLTNRLAMLVDQGVLRRQPYREPGSRARHEYRLTDKGFDLYPVLVAVREWGDRYLADPEGPPLTTVHRDCGAEVRTQLRCATGHEVAPRDILPRPGPGARPRETGARSPASGHVLFTGKTRLPRYPAASRRKHRLA